MGFMKNFFNGIVKRKAAKGMEKIMKDDPRVANSVRDARNAKERPIETKDFVDLNTPEVKLYYSKWLEKN